MLRHYRRPFMTVYAWMLAYAVVSTAVDAAAWEAIPTFSGTIVIEPDTFAPSTRLAGASGVWIRYTPTLSIDCSPPRGCYASTQRIYYDFNCVPRYAVVIERISMDLNGAVIKRETPGTYAPSNDEAANRILNAFCGSRERD